MRSTPVRSMVCWTLLSLLAPSIRADEFPTDLVDFVPYAQNPVFTAAEPGQWDAKIRERGWILRDDDGYHLWYTGYDGTKSGLRMLGYATSKDGIDWRRHPDNPIVRDHWVEDMMVLKREGVYYMVAEGKGDIAQLLTSTDKVHWRRQGSLDVRKTDGQPIDPGPYGTPTLYFEENSLPGGPWFLFYERGDKGIWLAASPDRTVWTNVSDNPVLALGPDPYDRFAVALNQIVKRDGRYYAYYHAADTPEWKRWSTNVATSTDLLHWTKYPNNPLLEDNKSSGILVHDGEGFRMYTMHNTVQLHLPRNRLVDCCPAPSGPPRRGLLRRIFRKAR